MNTKKVSLAKAEAILMGMTQPMFSPEETEIVLESILKSFKAMGLNTRPTVQEVLDATFKYTKDAKVKYVGVSVLMGEFRVLNLVLECKGAKCDVTSEDGVLAYCYNLDAPDLSELGYMFFEQTRAGLKRIA